MPIRFVVCFAVIALLWSMGCSKLGGASQPLPSDWPIAGFNFPPGTVVRQVTKGTGHWYVQLDCPGGWSLLSAHTGGELAGLGYTTVPSSDTGSPGKHMLFKSADGNYAAILETAPDKSQVPENVVKGEFWFTLQSKESALQ